MAGPRPSCVLHSVSCRRQSHVLTPPRASTESQGTKKEESAHIPVRCLRRHAHGVKTRSAKPWGLRVQGIDEAVDPRVSGGRGPREGGKGAGVGVGDEEALGCVEDRRGGGRGRVVAS